MAKSPRKVTLLTDAPRGESRFPKGTGFTVVQKLPHQLVDGEVDERTADAWLRFGWAGEAGEGRGQADAG